METATWILDEIVGNFTDREYTFLLISIIQCGILAQFISGALTMEVNSNSLLYSDMGLKALVPFISSTGAIQIVLKWDTSLCDNEVFLAMKSILISTNVLGNKAWIPHHYGKQ